AAQRARWPIDECEYDGIWNEACATVLSVFPITTGALPDEFHLHRSQQDKVLVPEKRGAVRVTALGAALALALTASTAPIRAAQTDGTAAPTIALLLPNVDAPRYENQDRPKFAAALQQICPDCKLLYYNADNDQAKQQSQAESAITNG